MSKRDQTEFDRKLNLKDDRLQLPSEWRSGARSTIFRLTQMIPLLTEAVSFAEQAEAEIDVVRGILNREWTVVEQDGQERFVPAVGLTYDEFLQLKRVAKMPLPIVLIERAVTAVVGKQENTK